MKPSGGELQPSPSLKPSPPPRPQTQNPLYSATRGYRYKDPKLIDGPIIKVSLRNGTLTINGKGNGLYTLENAPQGEMALRLQLGTGDVFCAAAEARYPASKNDSASRFIGVKNAPQPDPCPPLNPAPYGSASAAFLSAPPSLLD